jgi:hypothetical protein
MKRILAIATQVVVAMIVWFALVTFGTLKGLFQTSYGDYSRLEAKGITIIAGLFVCCHYLAYRLRRAALE